MQYQNLNFTYVPGSVTWKQRMARVLSQAEAQDRFVWYRSLTVRETRGTFIISPCFWIG